jgi:mannose-6-phosphate isomerase-like protein (cupin superfamily)
MLVKHISRAKEFIAGDSSLIRELLSPFKDKVSTCHSTAYARVLEGKTTLPHSLSCAEIYFITKGRGRIRIGAESAQVKAGSMVYIPPNAVQRIKNTGASTLEFLCIVDPPWQKGKEKILSGKKANNAKRKPKRKKLTGKYKTGKEEIKNKKH